MTDVETRCKSSRFKLLKIYKTFTSKSLQEEINLRKVPLYLATQYLKQVFVLDRKTQRKFIAFAFENIDGGLEINIPYPTNKTSFKTTIGVNSFTFIEGIDDTRIEIFESVWDFLTWLTMTKEDIPKFSSYILNGSKSVSRVIEHIKSKGRQIKSVLDFLDNDETGEALRYQIADVMYELDIRHGGQNYIYKGYKDLSSYWTEDPQASSLWPIRSEQPKVFNDTAWTMVMKGASSKSILKSS